jgi:hypothetical protein
MRPRHTFIAGGTYFIPGKFHLLNEYIAQPSSAQVKDCVGGITQLLELEGGQALSLGPDGVVELTRDITPSSESFSESVRAHSSDSYTHQAFPTVSLEELAAKFAAASANRADKLSRSGVKIGRRILFKAYDDLQTDFDLNIPSTAAATYTLEPTDPAASQQDYIVIHLDRQAMYGCLTRKLIWNQVLSGSLCLFERVPNTHEPDLLFSLNFLVA